MRPDRARKPVFVSLSLCKIDLKSFAHSLTIALDSLTAANGAKTQHTHTMKHYKTYQARNAVKAALVTNHIKKSKKEGKTHREAKAEAYELFNIKRTK